MKTFLKVILILTLIVAVLVGIVLGGIEYYLHSDSFKQMVRTGMRDTRGFRVDDFDVSLFRGVKLTGIAITNAAEARGISFSAESLVVRHRFFPLFHKRAELAEITLERPVITAPLLAAALVTATTNRFEVPPQLQQSGWQFVLDKFALHNGLVTLLGSGNRPLLSLEGFNLDVFPPQSSGTLRAEMLRLGALAVRQFDVSLKPAPGRLEMAEFRGALANGQLTGTFTSRPSGWQLQSNVRDADVPEMFRQAGLTPSLKGKLQTSVSLEGGAALRGQGRIEITGGTAAGMPLMDGLAALLQAPALRELKFDECRMDFTIAGNQMQMPVIRMVSAQAELTGHGTGQFINSSLDHNLTLVVGPEIAGRIPAAIQKNLTEQPDGRRALHFHVGGTYNAPKLKLIEAR